MLVNGKWTKDWTPVQKADKDGRFVRQTSEFRHWITPDGAPGPTGRGGFQAEPGRYRLYVAYICPWASRSLMVRKLKGLESMIPVTVVNPVLTDEGWAFGGFPDADQDPLFGASHLHQIYTRADPDYSGRATVPVLWDMKQNVMVNNESADILRMLDTAFEHLVPSDLRLYPADLAEQIDALNARIYETFNNGVYKAGFASSQLAYDEALKMVFATLDELEDRITEQYLFGSKLTETDIRLFVTLIRFDAAYYGLFKTNRKQIRDYPKLHAYLKRIYALPGIRDTVKMDHIVQGYYSIKALNPVGLVPSIPVHVQDILDG